MVFRTHIFCNLKSKHEYLNGARSTKSFLLQTEINLRLDMVVCLGVCVRARPAERF